MSDMIGIEVKGDVKNIQNFLQRYPKEAQDAIVDDVNKYLLDAVKTYPPSKYVTRKSAYGVTFFTEKQRRWFFAALADGRIGVPYTRTQGLREAWQIVDRGVNSIIVNEAPGAQFVMGDETQSRHEKKVGWRTVKEIINARMKRIVQIANGAAKKAIKKLRISPDL